MCDNKTANDNTREPNVIELKEKYDALNGRASKVALAMRAAVPLTDYSHAAQEAFILMFSDLTLLEQLLETAQNTLRGINLEAASQEQIQASDDFVATLADLANELVAILVEQFGVSDDVVIPAIIKDLARQLELIETIVVRAEENLAVLNTGSPLVISA